MKQKNISNSVGAEFAATHGIVTVGSGWGFIAANSRGWPSQDGRFTQQRFVITAAECLPKLPMPPYGASDTTYECLVGRLADAEATSRVSAECVFADGRANVAALYRPSFVSDDKFKRYQAIVEDDKITPIVVSAAPSEGRVSSLSVDGRWFGCSVRLEKRDLYVFDAEESLRRALPGSPILGPDGTAIGIVPETWRRCGDRSGSAPAITNNLPGWLSGQLVQVDPPANGFRRCLW